MNALNFGLLAVSLACVVFGSCLNNHVAKTVVNTYSDTLFYNLLLHVVGIVVMFLYARTFAIHASTLFLAALFGADSMLCTVLAVLSFKNGPMALSTLVGSAGSLLCSSVLGTILFHETVKPVQVVGIALILLAMVILTGAKTEGKLSRTWFVCILSQAFFGGMQGIIQKWQGATPYADEKPVFLLYTFIFCTIFVALWLVIRANTGKREKVTVSAKSFFPAAAIVGVTTSLVNIINLKLAIEIPAAVFFPINSGGYIILTSIASSLYFKEKLSKRQKVSFVIGFIAIFLVADIF